MSIPYHVWLVRGNTPTQKVSVSPTYSFAQAVIKGLLAEGFKTDEIVLMYGHRKLDWKQVRS